MNFYSMNLFGFVFLAINVCVHGEWEREREREKDYLVRISITRMGDVSLFVVATK